MRPMREADPYWQHDVAIELGAASAEVGFGVRFKIHEATERYGRSHEDLVRLAGPGTRHYFHAKPYQLEPDYRLTVALHPVPLPTGEIGVVERSSWKGFRQREIGQAQAWYYPEATTLVLWECFLEERYRRKNPSDDPLHTAAWRSWENWLTAQAPGISQIVTTWEDIYERPTWQAFLETRGYRQVTPASFARKVATQ